MRVSVQPVTKLDLGVLADLQRALATPASGRTSRSNIAIDLCGCTFSGQVQGDLVLPSQTVLCNGVIELGGGCHVSVQGSCMLGTVTLPPQGGSLRSHF